MVSATYHIKKYSGINYDELFTSLKDKKYSDSTGYGYEIEKIESQFFTALYICNEPTFIEEYNLNTGSISKTKVILHTITRFTIYKNPSYITISASKKMVKSLLTQLSVITHSSINISAFLPDYHHILDHLSDSFDGELKINGMQISEIQIEDGVRGSFYAKYFPSSKGITLLKKWLKDVTYINFLIQNIDESINIGMYKSGILRIYTSVDEQLAEKIIYCVIMEE